MNVILLVHGARSPPTAQRMPCSSLHASDGLVFPALDGGPQSPRSLSGDWREFRVAAKTPDVGLHALRHTHASMLIAANVDIVEISKRLGHADPSITLKVYAHLFRNDDAKSASAVETTLARIGA